VLLTLHSNYDGSVTSHPLIRLFAPLSTTSWRIFSHLQYMDWGGTHSDESSIIVLLLIHCDDDDLINMNVRQYNYIVFFNVTVVEFIMVLFLSSDPYYIIFDDITIFFSIQYWYINLFITNLFVAIRLIITILTAWC